MKTIALLRFGAPIPNPAVSQAIAPHVSGPCIATPVPGGILSVFRTESSEADIAEALRQTGAQFFMFDWCAAEIEAPEGFVDAVDRAVLGPDRDRNRMTPNPEAETLTIDQILDKINERGVESLTPAERQRLEAGR